MHHKQHQIEEKNPIIEHMQNRAHLPNTLMGGRDEMLAAGRKYLPQQPKEPDAAYKNRLNMSDLNPAYSKTVEDMTGKVFQSTPIVTGVSDDFTDNCLNDIDLAGTSFHDFCKSWFECGLVNGISFAYIDVPSSESVTIKEASENNIRPFWQRIPLNNVIDFATDTINNKVKLTHFRFYDSERVRNGSYSTKTSKRIRELNYLDGSVTFMVHEYIEDDDEWVIIDQGNIDIDLIPIVGFVPKKKGFFSGDNPMRDLADQNLIHYQSNSDQRHCLHITRVPFLFGAGFPYPTDQNAPKENELTISVGNAYILYGSEGAKLNYVEHKGDALGAGADELQKIEQRMQSMGLEMLVGQTAKTATGEVRENIQKVSKLSFMAVAFESSLTQAVKISEIFLNVSNPEEVNVEIDKSFTIVAMSTVEMSSLFNLAERGIISNETLYNEFRARGVFKSTNDYEQEQQEIAEQQEIVNPDI